MTDEQGKLIGMLSRVDVPHSLVNVPIGQEEHALTVGATVGEVMRLNVPTVPEDTPLEDIITQMVPGALRCVIVIDPIGRPVGLITDGDLVERVAPKQRSGVVAALLGRGRAQSSSNATARDLMSESVLSGPVDTLLATAVSQMLERQTKRFIVIDDEGRPLGLIDRQTALRALW